MTETAISAFTTLIVILDPIGLVPIFLSLTTGMSQSDRRRTALWATGLAALIMIGFAVGGRALLEQLGISLAAFRIAGGLMLFYTAFEMVFGGQHARRQMAAEDTTPALRANSVAAFPLAVPLLAGPGAITAVILLSGTGGHVLPSLAILVAVILLACLSVFVTFLIAEPVDRILGETGKIVLTRLLGVLLAALAVQFIADGVVDILRETS